MVDLNWYFGDGRATKPLRFAERSRTARIQHFDPHYSASNGYPYQVYGYKKAR